MIRYLKQIKIKNKMNLNKFSKAELISKLSQQKSLNNKLEDSIKESKNNSNIANQNSITFIDIISRLKTWILSLTIIAILSKIFSKYKSIRAVLKLLIILF